ncbi:MAG: hypothetical protein F2840_15960 [Actinobacteria bacterium]|nr:hypothetical protein [Actinomycetota bacterium]
MMLLAGCGGSAADGAAPVIRGDAASVAQKVLTVSNTNTTGMAAGMATVLTSSGGSGTGAVNFSVTGTACSVSETSLNATDAAICIVTATKEASTGFLEATSAPKTFRYSEAKVAQDTLTISNTVLTLPATTGRTTLTTTGGSGTGPITFSVSKGICSVTLATVYLRDGKQCWVSATRASSYGYWGATSETVVFTWTSPQATLSVSNTVLTDAVDDGVGVELATSGGSGDGVVTYTVTGTGCSVSGTSLNATPPATCVVTATKAASTGWIEATSATGTFTFLAEQDVLRLSGETLTAKVGNAIELTTSGGSGTGAVTFKVEGGACLFDGKKRLIATGVTVCIVTAKKAASTGYLATESESKTFSYTKK